MLRLISMEQVYMYIPVKNATKNILMNPRVLHMNDTAVLITTEQLEAVLCLLAILVVIRDIMRAHATIKIGQDIILIQSPIGNRINIISADLLNLILVFEH